MVWKKTKEACRTTSHGKLATKWEGSFKIAEALGNGVYRLAHPDNQLIPNTWNASHLKFYFS